MSKSLSVIVGATVGFFIGGPVGAAIGAGLGATKAGNNLVNKVLDFVLKPFMSDLGDPSAGNSAAREEGILITRRAGGSASIPVIYGFRQVGGIIVFAETGSDNNKYLWVAYALSEGPVEGVYSIEIDDADISNPTLISALNRGEEIDVSTGKYKDRVKMQFWYGKNFGSNAKSSPIGENSILKEAPSWKNTMAYNGLATLFVRYEWKKITTQEEADNNPFSGNIPNVKVGVLGRRILPIDSTAASRDWFTDVNAGRERYSTNPAEIILDYLRHPYYGKGLKNSEIDWDSFAIARNKYNQEVTYVTGVKGPILTANVVVDTDRSLFTNLKTLLQGARSYLPYVQGKYKLRVEDAGNPTDILSGSALVAATFTSDNIVGDISYGGIPRGNKYTEYEVTYVDPNNKWGSNTAVYPGTPAERQSYQDADGGRVNKGSNTFPTITNYAMAYDMARLLFFKSRFQETLNVRVTSQAFELEPGDNIQVEGNSLSLMIGPDAIPWRIISTKLNEDYSFDLGCVRNPDFIYPYVRARERDIILPPYIPKWAGILYPANDIDLSLYPPSHAYIGGDPIISPLQPPGATDPTGSTGGGVGSQNGNQNQNPITVAPPSAPPEFITTSDIIDITQVRYTVTGNVASATITFAQPDNPIYAGVDFWLSSPGTLSPYYAQPSSLDVPGPGRAINYTVNGLQHNTPYKLVARVKYVDGNSSSRATRPNLNSGGSPIVGDIPDYPETAGSGWGPGPVSTYVNAKNTTFASIVGQSSLDEINARLLSFTIRQDISVQAGGLNPEVAALNIYYKLHSDTFWTKHSEYFDGTYIAGNPYLFNPKLNLGEGNPGVPGENTDGSDNFDFIFRFVYRDGSESNLQWRFVNIDIQPTWNPTLVNPIREDTNAVNIFLAPPDAVIDPRNVRITLNTVTYLYGEKNLLFKITPPSTSNRVNWSGVRIYYRIVPSTGVGIPAFERLDRFNLSDPWEFKLPIPKEGDSYQIALIPVVRYEGVRTETYNGWYGEGKVFTVISSTGSGPDITANANYFNRLNFRAIETAQLANVSTPPPPSANPVINVLSFSRRTGSSATNPPPTEPRDPTNFRYFELVYNTDHIPNITNVRIYRRSRNATFGDTGSSSSTNLRHWGLGRWEFFDVDAAPTATPVSGKNAVTIDGNIVVNLRFPISAREFNQFVNEPLFRITSPWNTGRPLTAAELAEFVIVVTTTNGVSQEVAFLTSNLISVADGKYQAGLLTDRRPSASFNNMAAGTARNLTPGTNGSIANRTTNLFSTEATRVWRPPTPERGGIVL